MSKPTTPAPVIEAVNAILTQLGNGEHFRPDFTKYVQAAFDAGADSNHVKIFCPPLEIHEIALFREFVRQSGAAISEQVADTKPSALPPSV